jgi:hemerythrin-like domain-containing protein
MDEMKTMEMKPNVAQDLRRIHKVITRGLAVAGEKAQNMMGQDLSATHSLDGYLDYIRSLTSVLHAHHSTENDIGFPLFQQKSLDAPYDRLKDEHMKIEQILHDITPTIATLAAHTQDKDAIKKIHTLIRTLNDLWGPHIQIEESRFTEATLDEHLSAEEQRQLSMRTAQHMLKHATPEYLVVPFVLYNLSGQDRATMQKFLPPEITQTLIPITWKDRWAPMKPFLLD